MSEVKDFCTGCGWVLPIVRTEMQGKKEVKLCANCNSKPATDAMDAFKPLTKGLVDVTEKTRALWQERKARAPPPGDMQDAIAHRRELRQWFRRGVLLGALLATGIAFAFFNFIRGWS